MEDNLRELRQRVATLEQEGAERSSPSTTLRLNPNPRLRWLSEHRSTLIDNYSGEWIAISDEGIAGHDTSVRRLYQQMQQAGHSDASFVKVGQPLPAQSPTELLI